MVASKPARRQGRRKAAKPILDANAFGELEEDALDGIRIAVVDDQPGGRGSPVDFECATCR